MPDLDGLLALLPYGESFRFVDRVVHLDTDRIVTIKRYDRDDQAVAAHRVGGQIVVPGVHLLEQAAQSVLLLALARDPQHAVSSYWLAKIEGKFITPATPSCDVTAETDVVRVDAGFGFRTACRIKGADVAQVKGVVARRPKDTLK